jgi:DNA-binding transcriptional LysR family regulator
VAAGLGVSLLPAAPTAPQGVVFRPIEPPSPALDFVLAYRADLSSERVPALLRTARAALRTGV